MDEDAPLTLEEIQLFGPVVEAQVWTPVFLAEQRAPIAQAVGRPKFGKVFTEEGLGKAVLIRPCVSRGKRIRGLAPIYTPEMLEANATVFAGWPMYLDHAPPALTEAAAKKGRSVKELGGQVVTPFFDRDFAQEYDGDFGYQQGGVLAEIWASPFLRNLVGENPNLLHTSIAAWPTSGKPKQVPWNPKVKGMAIEGIRRQPQGSVDFVPRGGAGGRLLLQEGDQDPDLSPWPEPAWEEADERLVVSLAESFYASGAMGVGTQNGAPDFAQMKPDDLAAYVRENAPHLLPALSESQATPPAPTTPPANAGSSLTETDVRRIVEEAQRAVPTPEDFEQTLQEALDERDAQRALSATAHRIIESAEGIPATWKADLKARYSVLPSGPSPALLVESAIDDETGAELSEEEVLKRNVKHDLDHARDLIAEATGKPRVRGEGGATRKNAGDERPAQVRESGGTPYWRERFAEMGIVESADKALTVHGVEKVED